MIFDFPDEYVQISKDDFKGNNKYISPGIYPG